MTQVFRLIAEKFWGFYFRYRNNDKSMFTGIFFVFLCKLIRQIFFPSRTTSSPKVLRYCLKVLSPSYKRIHVHNTVFSAFGEAGKWKRKFSSVVQYLNSDETGIAAEKINGKEIDFFYRFSFRQMFITSNSLESWHNTRDSCTFVSLAS